MRHGKYSIARCYVQLDMVSARDCTQITTLCLLAYNCHHLCDIAWLAGWLR
jgi:hypothetical protein